jgi:hypothetical protein
MQGGAETSFLGWISDARLHSVPKQLAYFEAAE